MARSTNHTITTAMLLFVVYSAGAASHLRAWSAWPLGGLGPVCTQSASCFYLRFVCLFVVVVVVVAVVIVVVVVVIVVAVIVVIVIVVIVNVVCCLPRAQLHVLGLKSGWCLRAAIGCLSVKSELSQPTATTNKNSKQQTINNNHKNDNNNNNNNKTANTTNIQ